MEHLGELRTRLIYCFIGVCVASIAAYEFSTQVFEILCRPYFQAFPNSSLIGTGPAEALLLKFKVAFFCGVVVSGPFLFYQLWLFIAPGLYESEKKMVLPFVACTSLLFGLGSWFCYTFIIPVAFNFFHDEYLSVGLTPSVKVSEHLSMMIQAMVGFGVIFEMPVLAFFLARLGVINHRMMLNTGRYAVVIIFVVSAILTPPDILSQFLMAGPLCVLYALSIVIVKYAYREGKPDAPATPAVPPSAPAK